MEVDELSPSESIYGFAGWLTSRCEKTVMSSKHDAAPIAELVDKFCKENRLSDPRDGFGEFVKKPKSIRIDIHEARVARIIKGMTSKVSFLNEKDKLFLPNKTKNDDKVKGLKVKKLKVGKHYVCTLSGRKVLVAKDEIADRKYGVIWCEATKTYVNDDLVDGQLAKCKKQLCSLNGSSYCGLNDN